MAEGNHTPGQLCPYCEEACMESGRCPACERVLDLMREHRFAHMFLERKEEPLPLAAATPTLLAERDRLEEINAELLAALQRLTEIAEIACEHSVPGDCYTTGPRTGNPIADYIACPGCAALNEAKSARAALSRAVAEATK